MLTETSIHMEGYGEGNTIFSGRGAPKATGRRLRRPDGRKIRSCAGAWAGGLVMAARMIRIVDGTFLGYAEWAALLDNI